jgi:hypothetical protein
MDSLRVKRYSVARMTQMGAVQLDHFYVYGDVYESLDACDQLELLLGRLKRQGLITEPEWTQSRQNVAEIRARLESRLPKPD